MIGVIGGMGPYAGIDLVKNIFDMTKASSDQEHVPLSMISLPHLIEDRTAFLLGKSQNNPGIILSEIAMKLIEQGATAIGMPCNTAHSPKIISEIMKRIPKHIIFVNMIEKVVEHIMKEYQQIWKVGILSTSGALQTRIYDEELENNDLIPIVLSENDQMTLVDPSIYDKGYGIKSNSDPVSKNAKENLEKAIDVLGNDGAEAIILGCTEIPLAIKRTQHDSLPLINTTKILATALLLETKPDAINIEWIQLGQH